MNLRERDAFSNFILQIYIARVSKEIFSRLGLKLEFYFKMNLELGSLAFRGSVTASRLEDKNSNNKDEDVEVIVKGNPSKSIIKFNTDISPNNYKLKKCYFHHIVK